MNKSAKLYERKLAFIDTETTGLDPDTHELIEMGVLIYDPNKEEVEKEWDVKIAPSHIETASDVALSINGYADDPESYTGSLKSALIKFNSLTKDCMIVGQNVEFDIKFIKLGMEQFNIEPAFHRHWKLEMVSLAWWAIKNSDISGVSLAKLCDHFSISNVGAHRALTDCRRTYELYLKLADLLQPNLK
jgi:DNA polymerase III epsilon subunit-like protein